MAREPGPPVRRSLVLASASPRRRALLARLQLPFTIAVPSVDETPRPGEAGLALAARLAREKAQAVARTRPEAVVVAADTVVLLDEAILGKPGDAAEARAMLRALRGRVHVVATSVCVTAPGEAPRTATLRSHVTMRDYADSEIEAYIASGDPFDKAGAYAVQSASFRPAARVAGCWSNVVGLPLCLTCALLALAGLLPTVAADGAAPRDLAAH